MSVHALITRVEHQLLTPLVGPTCAHRLATLDTTATDCFKLFISKGLGIGIVAGSSILKVPQILKIVNSGSAKGISFSGYLLETLAFAISLAYNWRGGNPFSTYGELAFIYVQNILITLLILSYSKRYLGLILLALSLGAFSYALVTPSLISTNLLTTLQMSTIFLSIGSKLPQVWGNFVAKSTGQLSAITIFLQFAGSAARVFTTLQEIDDPVLLASNVIAFLLNVVILVQVIVYRKAKVPKQLPGYQSRKSRSSKAD
ncbi:hypothetical protein HDV00_001293 [Rhizophlyctis rosea]|nr:hypothetical protein HDV00_001293 [Rhizophlyctis rosea]